MKRWFDFEQLLKSIQRDIHRGVLPASLDQVERVSLPILSVLPVHYINLPINYGKYPITEFERNDSVSVNLGIPYQSICRCTVDLFEDYLFGDDEVKLGYVTLIYAGGNLVGVKKNGGNPVFLAFETYQDQNGAFPLIKGGLYAISNTSQSLEKWTEERYDSLCVNPIGMMRSIPQFRGNIEEKIEKAKERICVSI